MTNERKIGSATPEAASHGPLFILLLAYIFNFIDRQIIGVLAVPIKQELQLSDQQLGLMGGLAFALFYTTLALPIAWLADRKSRVNIIAASIALWSLFTALCGLTQNFWQLFLARMGVGIGEAGGVAPSYALIADLYPKEKRAGAMALFAMGLPIGSALGVFFGGWIASSLDWRAAFFIVGLAGLPIAALLKLFVKEPGRGCFDGAGGDVQAPPLREVAAYVLKMPSFWLLSLGSASASVLSYGLLFWLPSFFGRSFGLDVSAVSWFYGSIVLIGGVAGVWLGGRIADRSAHRGAGAYALIPAICFCLAVPVFAAALFARSLPLSWTLFVVGQTLALAWVGPVTAGVQQIVPSHMRAVTSAIYLFLINLLGIAFGVYFLGFMSDYMKQTRGEAALQYSILAGLSFYVMSAVLFLFAARALRKASGL